MPQCRRAQRCAQHRDSSLSPASEKIDAQDAHAASWASAFGSGGPIHESYNWPVMRVGVACRPASNGYGSDLVLLERGPGRGREQTSVLRVLSGCSLAPILEERR